MPDHPGVLERAAPVALERFERHVRGRGGEPALLERGPHVVRRLPEVARELDFPVPDGRDPVERPLEIALQRAAHGVELEADAVERGGRARQPAHARAVEARGEGGGAEAVERSEEHTSELQSLAYLVCRLLLEKK